VLFQCIIIVFGFVAVELYDEEDDDAEILHCHFFVVTTQFNAKRTMTTMMCYFSATSLFFVLLQRNCVVKKTLTQNFPHHHFFSFVAMQFKIITSTQCWYCVFALVLFLVFVVAQLCWSFSFPTTSGPCFVSMFFLFLVDGNSKEKKD